MGSHRITWDHMGHLVSAVSVGMLAAVMSSDNRSAIRCIMKLRLFSIPDMAQVCVHIGLYI